MQKLAESSGTIIFESSNKLFLYKLPAQWTSTVLFVTGLLSFLLLSNGMLQLLVLPNQNYVTSKVIVILLGIGILFLIASFSLIIYRRKIKSIPVNELKSICVLDFNTNTLVDGQGNLLSPINEVQLVRKMQVTSSSPSLMLKWKNGSLIIVNGNPFSGGVSAVEKAIISRGIKK